MHTQVLHLTHGFLDSPQLFMQIQLAGSLALQPPANMAFGFPLSNTARLHNSIIDDHHQILLSTTLYFLPYIRAPYFFLGQ